MKKSGWFAVAFGLVVLALTGPATVVTGAESDIEKATEMIKMAQETVRTLNDFTCIFSKAEYKGKQLPKEVVDMKWRKQPRSVYMKWIGDEKKGQQALWVKGKNNDKLRAKPPHLLAVSLATDSWLAMKDSRHTVTEAGFDHTVELIAKDLDISMKHPDYNSKIKLLGEQVVNGAPSVCFEAEMDKEKHPEFYAQKALICASKEAKVPNKVQIWMKEDGEVRLVEDYGYENIKLNVGLTDKDFDPATYGL